MSSNNQQFCPDDCDYSTSCLTTRRGVRGDGFGRDVPEGRLTTRPSHSDVARAVEPLRNRHPLELQRLTEIALIGMRQSAVQDHD